MIDLEHLLPVLFLGGGFLMMIGLRTQFQIMIDAWKNEEPR